MTNVIEQPRALSCLEVWGGNQHASALLEPPGSESFNGEEKELGLQGLLDFARQVPVHFADRGRFFAQFRNGEPRRDDATLLVLQRQAN